VFTTSPAARLQDEQTLSAMGRAMEFFAMLPPELVNAEIRIEDFPSEIVDVLGLPSKFKRSDEEKMQMQQQAAQQEQQQQQMAAEQVAQEQA